MTLRLAAILGVLLLVAAVLVSKRMSLAVSQADVAVPALDAPAGPMKVYHLGHSLVGAEMPDMLQQLAGADHDFRVQRGSGTSLKAHWEPEMEILDFDVSNSAEIWADPKEALTSGDYDAVVLTEMVELRDAVKYFDAAKYLRNWADLARDSNPETRIYLYETWHHLNDPDGWQARIATDLNALWLNKVLGPDSRANPDRPVYLIPAGQVMAAVAEVIERGETKEIQSISELFDDTIHINDLGAYVVALTHYAVLYHRSPVGLPYQLHRADGTPALGFSAEDAATIQTTVWKTVLQHPRTGLSAAQIEQVAAR